MDIAWQDLEVHRSQNSKNCIWKIQVLSETHEILVASSPLHRMSIRTKIQGPRFQGSSCFHCQPAGWVAYGRWWHRCWAGRRAVGFAKHDAVVLHAAVIDMHGFSKKFAVLKDREEWELKIFVSQLKISCEYYHLSGKQWRRLCVWAACLFRTNLRGRFFLMQSVEHGTRCGGYSPRISLSKQSKESQFHRIFGSVGGETEARWGLGQPRSGGHPERERGKTGERTSRVLPPVRKTLKKMRILIPRVCMGSLFIKEQSVEDRTRCGGCSRILVKAVKGVAVSSYFGMVAGETEERLGQPRSGGHPEGEW